jgi:hypothetical protein
MPRLRRCLDAAHGLMGAFTITKPIAVRAEVRVKERG